MTEENNKQEELQEENISQQEDLKQEQGNVGDLPNDPEELKKLLTEKISEAENNLNRAIRIQADYENLRRRTRQEREELLKFGSEQLIKNLLSVLDNFDRAMSSAGDGGEKFINGVQMIHRQLNDILSSEGLSAIPATGEKFDPNLHEAVMQVEDTDETENTVVEELRKGYYLKGKVIRPSMVKVAK